ncbi:hypothetical protein ACMU_11490 [Actibacterium mucosum KCTC 23349]|uniref:Pilus assembly protein TadE n=1 Tax=Actibacterium mucosum KCTC 23349 TaxID=1454373 RepID=A0A037ZI77_9RHOB|nr:hypothetical protein ACMU_11490 [Actibacterium mucosum KCTC 23349]
MITAEAVIAMPFLVWWYIGSFVFFDAFQARNVNLKAAYTVADMLSREDGSVNANYIYGLERVYSYLATGSGSNAAIRVTLVRCSQNCDQDNGYRLLEVDWSMGTDDLAALTTGQMSTYLDDIPIMPAGDRVILLETFIDYEPAWDVGILNPSDFDNLIVTRPRFVPQIQFES